MTWRARLILARAFSTFDATSRISAESGSPVIAGIGRHPAFELLDDLVALGRIGAEITGMAPLEGRLELPPNPPEGVAEMVVDHRIFRLQFDGALELADRVGIAAKLEIRPTQAVDDVAVV